MVITLKTNSATHMEKRGERPLVDSPVSGLISMVNSLLWPLVVEVVVMEYGSTVPRGQSLRVLQLSLCRVVGRGFPARRLGDAPCPPNQSTVEKPRPLTLSFSTVHCVSYDTRSQRELALVYSYIRHQILLRRHVSRTRMYLLYEWYLAIGGQIERNL